jgi:RHS repeat-associated protein
MKKLLRNTKKRYIAIITGLLLFALNTSAQTFIGSSVTGTLAPGEYYNNSSITLSHDFVFAAAAGQSLHLYTTVADCAPLSTNVSTNRNYIITSSPRIAGITDASLLQNRSTCDLMQSVQYFDGLGRLIQTVQVKGSAGLNDVVQPAVYDAFGREGVKYLPYTSSINDGSFKTSATTFQAGFYSTPPAGVTQVNSPIAITGFDSSPLNRVTEQGAPGTAWQPTGDPNNPGHTLKMDYVTNDQSTVFNGTPGAANLGSRIVALYTAITNSDQTRTLARTNNDATYAPGTLYITISKDENWIPANGCVGTTEEYKDIDGHVVLKRTYNLNNISGQVEMLSTYYVYDEFGNLAFVLPPGSTPDNTTLISQSTLDNLCYQYRYDERSRLSQKKLPGKGWEFMIYNTLDQVTFTQDANQRNKSVQEWTFIRYDGQGRVVMTGIWVSGDPADGNIASPDHSRQQWLQNWSTAHTPLWATRDNTTASGYNNDDPPGQLLTISYYDDYDFPGNPYTSFTGSHPPATGLLTATQTAVLNPDGTIGPMLWEIHGYDDQGREALTIKQHYQGGQLSYSTGNFDVTTSTYNFDNQVAHTTRAHITTAGSTPSVGIGTAYYYDHMGRPTQIWKSIWDEHLAQPNGTLISQKKYNEIGQLMAKQLHSIDNGASFLQNINYAYNERGWLTQINDPDVAPAAGKLFSLKLNYNNTQHGALAQFNGNIAEQQYNAGYGGFVTYAYDGLNRLTSGTSSEGFTENGISYDYMGNIMALNRTGPNSAALGYNYIGNQLQTVTNSRNPFRSYGYDGNGNATSDGLGNGISYNMLNLPASIPGKNLTYVYSADGDKLRKIVNGSVTEYIDGIVYKPDGTIDFVLTEEGRAINNGGTYSYEYTLTDHLGNNRVTFDQTNGKVGEDNYYPFGLNVHRQQNAGNPYLYNGKELQEALNNQYDYGARFYDPVIGRFTSIDAYAEKYSPMTPYQYGALNPISNIDMNGDSIRVNTTLSIPIPGVGNINVNTSLYYQGGTAYYQNGTAYNGKDPFVVQLGSALSDLSQGSIGKALVNDLEGSTNNTTALNDSRGQGNLTADDGNQVRWNPNGTAGGPDQKGSTTRPSFIGLGHEFAHVQDVWGVTIDRGTWYSVTDANGNTVGSVSNAEKYATYMENQIRGEQGLSLREFYSPTSSGGGYEPSRILNRGTSVNKWIYRDPNPLTPVQQHIHIVISPAQMPTALRL